MIVGLFAAFVALAGLTAMPPIDRDEARFAQASAQMLETGDVVAIRFLDEERNKKPAGAYWLQAISVAAVSDADARQIWAHRLPSVLGVVLAALFTTRIGERLFGAGPGLLAGLLLASAPIVAAEATMAKADAALLAATTGAMAAFVDILARTADGKPVPRAVPIAFWIAVGAGTLIKGPIILLVVLPTAALAAWRFAFIDVIPSLRPLTGAAVLAAMVLPWLIAVSVETEGRFIAEAVGRDMLGKVGAAQELHAGPPGYHLALLWPLFWPAVPLIADGAWRAVKGRDKWRWFFLIAWIVPAWIIFELTATKLPHYPLPLYPAIALIAAAAALERGDAGHASWRRRWGAAGYFAIGCVFAMAIAVAPFAHLAPGADGAVRAALRPLTGVGLALLLIAASGAIAMDYHRGRAWRPALAASGLSAAFAWAMLGLTLPNLSPTSVSTRLADAIDAADLHALRDEAPGAILIGYTEPSAVFLLGSGTAMLNPAGAAKAASATPGGAIVVDDRSQEAFQAHAKDAGLSLRKIMELNEFNYSNGRNIRLTIYANE